jgi:sarcosine oxidase subunit gamma
VTLRPGRSGRADGPAGVTVTPLGTLAMAAIAARRGADPARLAAALGAPPPERPGCVQAGHTLLVWSGPGQWLALRRDLSGAARHGFAPRLAEALGDAASVTAMTGSRMVLRLSGPAVRDALAKLVPIDLDPEAFPPGAAALANGGYLPVHLWCLPGPGTIFELACYRSYGESLAQAVLAAAREYGCEVAAAA